MSRDKPKCVDCGRPGYGTMVGTSLRVVGHVDQRIKHAFRTDPMLWRERLVRALADAMLEAKAGAAGSKTSADQLQRTRWMADWIIARLPFHDLVLYEKHDGLTDDARQAQYREWLAVIPGPSR